MTMYGMSKMGELENDAKVAVEKAKRTDKPDDWRAAAEAWKKAEDPRKVDYCNKMAAMLEGLSK